MKNEMKPQTSSKARRKKTDAVPFQKKKRTPGKKKVDVQEPAIAVETLEKPAVESKSKSDSAVESIGYAAGKAVGQISRLASKTTSVFQKAAKKLLPSSKPDRKK